MAVPIHDVKDWCLANRDSNHNGKADMDMKAFFSDLAERGIRVLLDDNGALRVKGKKEQLDATLVAQLKACKSEIAEYLKNHQVPLPAPVQPVAKQVLPSDQQQRLISNSRAALSYYKSDAFGELTLHGLFEAQVVEHPNKPALEFKQGQLSFAQLNKRANQMATFLRREGIEFDDLVGLCFERSIDLIVAMLAVLKCGGAFVVVTPDNITPHPDCTFKLMLSCDGYSALFEGADHVTYNVDRLEIKQAIEVCSSANPPLLPTQNAFSLACVQFGACPKGVLRGVMIEHGNVIAMVDRPGYLPIKSRDVFGLCAPLDSEAALFEIWCALCNGITLVEIDRHLQSSPLMLKQALALTGVTVLHLPMSLLSHLIRQRPDCFGELEYLLFSGGCHIDDINAMVDGGRPKHLYQLYGVVENTGFGCVSEISGRIDSYNIGKAVGGAYCFVLDDELNPQATDSPGTLYIGGFGLARGYLGDWLETERHFLPSPFSDDPNDRVISTGRRAKALADGTIELLDTHHSEQQSPVIAAKAKAVSRDLMVTAGQFFQPVWQSEPLSTLRKTALLPDQCFVVFCDKYGIGDRLAQLLRLASAQVLCVRVGQQFERINCLEFVIEPTREQDYRQLCEQVLALNQSACHVIHLWSIEALNPSAPCEPLFEQLARFDLHCGKGFGSIEYLKQALHASGLQPLSINLVTRQCCSVTSDEKLIPSAATIGALVDKSQMIVQIDLGLEQLPPRQERMNQLCDFIFAELSVDKRRPLVAYRGKQRWKATESRCSLHPDNAININRAGQFLLIGSQDTQLNDLADQLKLCSAGASVCIVGDKLTERKEDCHYIETDVLNATAVGAAIEQARGLLGAINGIIFIPAPNCPHKTQVEILLSLDMELSQHPSEFCLVLSPADSTIDERVSNLYAQSFVQHKHNGGCERWIHVQLQSKDISSFSIAQLMQLERIANLSWRC